MEKKMPNRPTRRDLLKISAASALAATGVNHAFVAEALADSPSQSADAKRRRVLRIAHLTDIHVQPERAAGDGMAECLRHAQSLEDPPNIIFNGGDAIMDSLATDKARAKTQWDLWQRVLKQECTLPIVHCIGNHDVWGWNKTKSGCNGNEDLYGKKWAVDSFGLKERYYSFDRAGWHFVVLDSTFPHGEGYKARLDEPQFEWLADDLKNTPATTPILILSHIPILSAAAFFDGECEKAGDWDVPGAWMHIDARRLKDLFLKHPNVKTCLSGHLHLVDRVDYNGVSYLCNGAVSGNWWKGRHQEFDEGYALVNLYSDGSFDHEYTTFGWRVVAE